MACSISAHNIPPPPPQALPCPTSSATVISPKNAAGGSASRAASSALRTTSRNSGLHAASTTATYSGCASTSHTSSSPCPCRRGGAGQAGLALGSQTTVLSWAQRAVAVKAHGRHPNTSLHRWGTPPLRCTGTPLSRRTSPSPGSRLQAASTVSLRSSAYELRSSTSRYLQERWLAGQRSYHKCSATLH